MKLKIGENIKYLRRTRDITQEALAEMLGVSCQSVSRWELNVCYPDMELLPTIAGIFRVSVDNLLGVDDTTEKQKVDQYLDRFQRAINKGQVNECITIAREGAAEFPNNYALLNKLMYALFISGDDDGNIPEWKENMEKYDAEIIALGERIMKYCPDQDIRLEATARLAFQHVEMGRRSIGRSVYETLPSKEFCRENQIWWGLEEDEKASFIRNNIKDDYESLNSWIWSFATSGCFSDEDALTAFEKLSALDDLIFDGNLPQNSWDAARLPYDQARIHARLGQKQQMYQDLESAVKAAEAFDHRPETQSYSCTLLGTVEENILEFETGDSRTVCEIMRDKWLANSAFDPYRNEADFQEILARLTAGMQ